MKSLKMLIQPSLNEKEFLNKFVVMPKDNSVKVRIVPTPQLFEYNVTYHEGKPIERFYYPVIVKDTDEMKIFSVGTMLHSFILTSIVNSFIPSVEIKNRIKIEYSIHFRKMYALYYEYNFAHDTLIDLETGRDLCIVKEIEQYYRYPIYDSSHFVKKSRAVNKPHIVEKAVQLLSQLKKV